MDNKIKFTALDEYRIKVSKLLLVIVSLSAVSGLLFVYFMHALRYYSNKTIPALIIYTLIVMIEIGIGRILAKRLVKDNYLDAKYWRITKIFLVSIVLIDYNFMIYLVQTPKFWYSVGYFILVIGLFLELKIVYITSVGTCISAIIYFIKTPEAIYNGNDFVPNLCLVVFTLALLYVGVIMLVYYAGYVLTQAKEEEVKRNENRLLEIIDKTSKLMENLNLTNSSLEEIAKTEYTSMQEIASITTAIKQENDNIVECCKKNNLNFNELNTSNKSIVDKVKNTQDISRSLINISIENESSLNKVLGVSEDIRESTNNTLNVTKSLSEKSERVDKLLGIIQQVSEETNLLALNASIEAAKAGENGKSFAVIASEVKKLAENTDNSLKDVTKVISEFKEDTKLVEKLTQINSDKIINQNKMIINTVERIKSMITELQNSYKEIDIVESLSHEHNECMMRTMDYNKQTVKYIGDQIEQFNNISTLISENKVQIESIVYSVKELNVLILEIDKLLQDQC